jgi:IS30 family transposase
MIQLLIRKKESTFQNVLGQQASSTIIMNRIDISQRPNIVELKTRVGDFEIDTVVFM